MHQTSFTAMQTLVRALLARTTGTRISVLDVGSMIAREGHVSYKEIFDALGGATYTGLDMAPGKNVDIVPDDPYRFPLAAESFDLVISGQAFEHVEFPWLTMREIARVLKGGGSAIVIAPSSGPEHRYPQDCWRFYPDGMRAFARWAGLECIDAATNWRETRRFEWGDTVGLFCKRGAADARRPLLRAEDLQQVIKAWDTAAPPPRRSSLRRALDRHILWRFDR